MSDSSERIDGLMEELSRAHQRIADLEENLSNLKVCEGALRESEARLRGIAENLPGAVYQFYVRNNGEMGLHYVSERTLEILGLVNQPDDFFDRFVACVDPEDREGFLASIGDKARSFSNWEYEVKFLTPAGQEKYIRGISRPRLVGNEMIFDGVLLDVTDQRRTEIALKESERRFRDLAENSSDLIWETDEQLRFTYMNRKIVDHLGYGPEDRIGKSLLEVIPPGDAARLAPFLRNLIESPQPFQDLEYTAVHVDGSMRIRQASGVPIYNNAGRCTGYRGVTRDITTRRTAEDELKKSEAKYRFLTEKMSDIVWTMDLGLRTTYVSPSISRLLGYAPEERVKQDPKDQLTKESYVYCIDLLSRELEQDGREGVDPDRMVSMELEYYQKNGTTLWLENVVSGIRDENGDLVGLHGVSRDITERKRTEERLQASEKKFFTMFHSSPVPIVLSQPDDGMIIDCNVSSERWSGYSREELIGHTTFDLGFWLDPYDRDCFMRSVRKRNLSGSSEMMFLTRDGSIHDVLLSSRIIEVDGKSLMLTQLLDITERKKTQKALIESEERLRGIAENFPGVVFQFYARDDGETGVYYISERTKLVLGIENDLAHFLDQAICCMAPEDRERFHASVRDATQAEDTWDFICRFIKPDGEEIYVRGISQPVRHGHELIFSGVLFNVTEQRLLDKELKRHREQLEEMVLSRTSELTDALEKLTKEIEARKKTEAALRFREMELQDRGIELEEMNAALKVLLKQREEDKSSMELNIVSNMKTFVIPHVEKIEGMCLEDDLKKSITMIKSHLEEITSPFIRRISAEYLGFTPSEIQVASLIREGKSSKEIARLLNISLNTVHTYRFNIRKKAGLKNNKINLRSYLKTLE